MRLFQLIAPAVCIVLAPWLAATGLPRFEPQPLLIEVNAPQESPPINAQYLVVGQAALDAPIRIEPAATASRSFTEPAELFDFIKYYVSRVKSLEKPEELLEFSYVEDHEIFARITNDPKKRERLMAIYHGVNHMEYIFGWFESPDIFCALMRVDSSNDPRPYITTIFFTFRDGEWKVFSGFRASDQILKDMTYAVWKGGYEEKLKLNPIPDSLRTAHQTQIHSRSVVKVE